MTDPRKLHRTDSPDTSVAAAESVDTTRLENMVYEAICRFGPGGGISDQVRDKFPDLSYSSVTARYAALKAKGLIVCPGERRPGKSGRGQAVMVATKFLETEDGQGILFPGLEMDPN